MSQRPNLAETLGTLGLAVAISFLIDSVLIVVGFAVASNFVEGVSCNSGMVGVIFMVLSLVVTWPVVLIPLVLIVLGRRIALSMPAGLFVVVFSTAVTASFLLLLFLLGLGSSFGFTNFMLNPITQLDACIALMVSSTFAILFRLLSPRPRR